MDRCHICGRTEALQLHHIVMQASGGEDGPTVYLCGTDHDKIHQMAMNLESKNPEKIQFFSAKEWPRARTLVEYIQLAIRKNKYNPDMNDPYTLQIKITKGEAYLLHLMKIDSNYSNLTHYVRDLIKGFIRSKFPAGK